MANISCSTCEKWLVDLKRGRVERHLITQEPIARPPGSPTPCLSCPKCEGLSPEDRNPTAGRRAELSERNAALVELYFRRQGSGDTGPVNAVAMKAFGVIRELIELKRSHGMDVLAALLTRAPEA